MSVPGTYPHRAAILRPPVASASTSASTILSRASTSRLTPVPEIHNTQSYQSNQSTTEATILQLEPNGSLRITDKTARYVIKGSDVGSATIKMWGNPVPQFTRDVRVITQTHIGKTSEIRLEMYEDEALTTPANTIYMSRFTRPPFGVCGSARETIVSRTNPSQKIVDIHHISYDGDVIVSTIY